MPFLFLALGVVLLLVFIAMFQNKTSIDAQRALWRFVLLIIGPATLFYLIILGRFLPAVLVLFVAIPFVVGEIKALRRGDDGETLEDHAGENAAPTPTSWKMSRDEALDVLGLEDGAGAAEVQEAYTRLIKKNHPDQEGNEWLASKINAARDVLLPQDLRDK